MHVVLFRHRRRQSAGGHGPRLTSLERSGLHAPRLFAYRCNEPRVASALRNSSMPAMAGVAALLLALLVDPTAARGRRKSSAGSCTNINFGSKPCSGTGSYKSLLDYAGSAAGKNTASAELAIKMTDYSVQEIDWAKAVASGTCKALPTCNGSGRTDGVKGRKDISDKVRIIRFRSLLDVARADLRFLGGQARGRVQWLEHGGAHGATKRTMRLLVQEEEEEEEVGEHLWRVPPPSCKSCSTSLLFKARPR